MSALSIMSDNEENMFARIEVLQYALQKIATDAGGISDRDAVKRMRDIATKALKGE